MQKKLMGIIISLFVVSGCGLATNPPTTATEFDDPAPITTPTGADTVTSPPSATTTPEPSQPTITEPTTYTMAEVQKANNSQKCWSTINGQVYDLTKYIYQHKGGAEKILSICGKDGTSTFENQHGEKQNIVQYLQTMRIGALK